MHRRLWPVVTLLLVGALAGFVPVLAQEEEEELPVVESPWDEVTSYDDPSLPKEDPLFEEPLDKYEGSEALLEKEKDGYSVGMDAMSAAAAWTELNCSQLPPDFGVAEPIRLAAANPRYFSYGGIPLLLVGASADCGCAFRLKEAFQCNLNNYASTFALNKNTVPSLNKVRVWVSMGYGYANTPTLQLQVPNAPFEWVTPLAGSSYWLLDNQGVAGTGYEAFFARLLKVVNAARVNRQFVEVTLFIPWQGNDFLKGPWSKTGGLAKAAEPPGTANLVTTGFTSAYYQVHKDTGSPNAAQNEKMRAYQINIINWTVKTLWCFDNVFFEVSNEPEAPGPKEGGVAKAVNPVAVAKWQRQMIFEIRKAEKTWGGSKLSYGHLISAQPFSQAGALALFDPANAPATPGWTPDPKFPLDLQVLNGHYTTARLDASTFGGGTHRLDAGAIDLVRDPTLNKKPNPIASNEDNITNIQGARGTKHHLNGVAVRGGVVPIRAAAWELLTSGGTSYDHFGYLLAPNGIINATARAIRTQLGLLLDFYGRRSFDLPSPTPRLTDFAPARVSDFFKVDASGGTDLGRYGSDECRTKSQNYWSALGATARNPSNPSQIVYRA
ncbi:MAG TPA: hypothetical protein DD490_20490, partial [Acidobacteria bacterium]|nr:hypothetical protein [Acidobacteriota bacterium]